MAFQFPPPQLERPAAADDLDRMAAWLKPLASPLRLRLLRYLTKPHYLEEIASHMKLTRQAARKHVEKLVRIGVLERRSGVRPTGAVTEYVIDPKALFLIYDEFENLGTLRREEQAAVMVPTMAESGRRREPAQAEGPCVTVVRGLNIGHRAVLSKGAEFTVGRDERCDLVVSHDPYASNRHAEIRWEGGRFVLSDLRSTNGTRHNWQLLARGATVPLQHGDLVGVGKTLLLFWGAA